MKINNSKGQLVRKNLIQTNSNRNIRFQTNSPPLQTKKQDFLPAIEANPRGSAFTNEILTQ